MRSIQKARFRRTKFALLLSLSLEYLPTYNFYFLLKSSSLYLNSIELARVLRVAWRTFVSIFIITLGAKVGWLVVAWREEERKEGRKIQKWKKKKNGPRGWIENTGCSSRTIFNATISNRRFVRVESVRTCKREPVVGSSICWSSSSSPSLLAACTICLRPQQASSSS